MSGNSFFLSVSTKTCSQSSSCGRLFHGESVFPPQHVSVINAVCQNQTSTPSLLVIPSGLMRQVSSFQKRALTKERRWRRCHSNHTGPRKSKHPCGLWRCCNVLHQVDEGDCCRRGGGLSASWSVNYVVWYSNQPVPSRLIEAWCHLWNAAQLCYPYFLSLSFQMNAITQKRTHLCLFLFFLNPDGVENESGFIVFFTAA